MKSLYYKQSNYDDIYQKYIDDYSSRENSLPIYNVDLDDALNKNFVSSDLNISDNIEDLKLNDEVLFKIKDGKIEKYSVGNKQIIEQLSNL